MTTYVQLLLAEHGHSSDTYDFTYCCVLVDKDNKILQVVPGGRLAHWLLSWKHETKRLRYYGHSYAARQRLWDDLEEKQVRDAPASPEL